MLALSLEIKLEKSPFPPKPVRLFKETLTVIWLTKGGNGSQSKNCPSHLSASYEGMFSHFSSECQGLVTCILGFVPSQTGVCYSLPTLQVYGLTPELESVPIINSRSALSSV